MNNRYCIYARVSPKGSQWAAQETSIRVQLQECRDYILSGDPRATFIEIYDEFRSGKDLNRPGMQQIIQDIESGRPSFDTLVVWQLDRLSRNLADAAPLFEKLRDAGLGFISIRQNYLSATGAMARFNLTQTIAIAQLEREMTSERITAKMRWIASQGKATWGRLPLGYRRKEGVKNTAEVVPEDAAIIKSIFQLYLAGHRCGSFEDLHNFCTVHKEKIGDRKKIYKLLRNRFYIGEIPYKGEVFKGEHQPIVDRELFEKVQQLLPGDNYNAARPGRRKYAYLLSGLVRCHCDQARYMTPSSVNKKASRYFYYLCTDSNCKCRINAEKLDEAVLDVIKRISLSPEYIKTCYARHQEATAQLRAKEEKKLAAVIAECEEAAAELKNIDGIFLSGIVSPENAGYWNDKLLAARTRYEAAEKRRKETIAALEPVQDQEQLAAIIQSLSSWAAQLECDPEDNILKRNLILSTVRQVRCTEKGKFEVDLVFTTEKHKKIDITPAGVMSNGDEWWCAEDVSGMRFEDCIKEETDAEEIRVIEAALQLIGYGNRTLLTFNGNNFDVPFIYRRAVLLGIDVRKFHLPPLPAMTARYRNDLHHDLMNIWCGVGNYEKLDNLAAAILGDRKNEIDFHDFPEMIKTPAGREELLSYCRQDVALLVKIYLRVVGILI